MSQPSGAPKRRSAVMRYDDVERLLFKLPPDIFGYFTVIVNNQDAHLS
jgi:hypothetical protein